MGTIADRLSLKTDPLYARAKALAQHAVACTTAEDDDSFESNSAAMDAIVVDTPILDTQKLWDLVQQLLSHRSDQDEVLEEVCDSFDATCTAVDLPDGVRGHLVALPVNMDSQTLAWNQTVTPDAMDAVHRALCQFDLVEEGASVVALPRILAALEADRLGYVELRSIMHCLATGGEATALEIVNDCNARNEIDLLKIADNRVVHTRPITTGILVLLVLSWDPEPFPLAMALDAELFEADESREQEPERSQAQEMEAIQDVNRVLEEASEPLAEAFGAVRVTISMAPQDWFTGVSCACQIDRKCTFLQWLGANGLKGQGEDTSMYYARINLDNLSETGVVQIDLLHSTTSEPMGGYLWPYVGREEVQECVTELCEALLERGVTAFRRKDLTPGAQPDEDLDDEPLPLFMGTTPPKLLH